MKRSLSASCLCSFACALLVSIAHAQIAPTELVAPKMEISGGNLNFTIQPSVSGRNYQLQWSDSMEVGTWTDIGMVRSGDGSNIVISTPYVAGVARRFYRLALSVANNPAPEGFVLIPAGSFQMGDQSNPPVGFDWELPVHTVDVSAFYMAKYMTTRELWDEVRDWGMANGYTDLPEGYAKASNHPVVGMTWFDVVKWCNARSQKEGLTPCYTVDGATYNTGYPGDGWDECNWSANGYRLPTEAEWEKAARGGVVGKNFPWGTDTITHNQANYCVYSSDRITNDYSYDVTPDNPGFYSYYHPTYAEGEVPYSSPVGSFPPNGYGLYDMAGNAEHWCWDWFGPYAEGSQSNPRGPAFGPGFVIRGGSWRHAAIHARCVYRKFDESSGPADIGFRVARGKP